MRRGPINAAARWRIPRGSTGARVPSCGGGASLEPHPHAAAGARRSRSGGGRARPPKCDGERTHSICTSWLARPRVNAAVARERALPDQAGGVGMTADLEQQRRHPFAAAANTHLVISRRCSSEGARHAGGSELCTSRGPRCHGSGEGVGHSGSPSLPSDRRVTSSCCFYVCACSCVCNPCFSRVALRGSRRIGDARLGGRYWLQALVAGAQGSVGRVKACLGDQHSLQGRSRTTGSGTRCPSR